MRISRLVPVAGALALVSGLLVSPSATAASSAALSSASGARQPSWQRLSTGSTTRFRGLSAVSRKVAWLGGFDGIVLRTVDGGATWASVGPPDAAAAGLQFRDVEATSARHAVAMSAGEGTDSRIYVTDNGGTTWTESFRNTDPAAFYDCLAFTDDRHGVAVSDPVGGRLRLLATKDGGHSWKVLDPAAMPAPNDGEFFFAASGTCLTAGSERDLFLGSGGADPARVFTSHDGGRTWTVTDTPLVGGPSSGIFSVRFQGPRRGIAVGGDYLNPTDTVHHAAWTADGGRTWHEPSVPPSGYRSGSAWVGERPIALAVGPTGSDWSTDGGRTWRTFDTGSLDSVECTPDGACWASGADGAVAVLRGLGD